MPWGDGSADTRHGNFGVARFDPVPVDSFPSGASAFGVHDLMGNGWEWTASPFQPFPGFRPMVSYPRYSVDFFDGDHAVLKGASPVTAAASREAQLPQLVSDAVSVRLREVPHGRRVSFASDVRRGLGTKPYRLPPHWFYDELGSRLFDAICLLPWYRITRVERRLLRRAARAMARGTPRPALVAELGPGNGEKLTLFLEDLGGAPRVLLVDISPEALAASTARLAKAGFSRVAAVRGTYEAGPHADRARASEARARARALPRVQRGEFRADQGGALSEGREVRSRAGGWPSPGSRSREAGEGSPPRLRRPARRDGRVQPQRSRAHEPRAGGGHRPDVLRAPGRLERGGGAHGDVPREPASRRR